MDRLTIRNKKGSIDVKLNGSMQRTYETHLWAEIFEKLAHYEDLEESGLLHIAPVRDGTKIFYIDYRDFMDFGKMVFDDTYLNGFTEYCHGEFNKDWFLTHEEADNKLKEMRL